LISGPAKYRHLFFDLDHTIWDFDRNAEETLQELFVHHELGKLGISSAEVFIETYTRNNHQLWTEYHLGRISKEHLRKTRFNRTFTELGLHEDNIPKAFEEDYVRICPTKTNLFPRAHETLAYLGERYALHLISNGFKESTEYKIGNTGLAGYFQTIVISEVAGANKPHRAIFEYALNGAGAIKKESLMIGDSLEADVYGALDFGMDAVYFNPGGKEKPANVPLQVGSLSELIALL
jgi:putative hydrolase of the HAD superfamily